MATTVAVLVVSDTCAEGNEIARGLDKTGPALAASAAALGEVTVEYSRDNVEQIQSTILELADSHQLILTAGGTGFSIRDVTPEAVAPLLEREAPGLVVAMLTASLRITPYAALARPVAGTLGKCLIVTLPGSPKGAIENFEAIRSVLSHAIKLNKGGDSRSMHKRDASVESIASISALSASPVSADGETVFAEIEIPVKQCSEYHRSGSDSERQLQEVDHHHCAHHHHSHAGGPHSGPKFYGPAHRSRQSPFPMIPFDEAVQIVLENTPSLPRVTKVSIEEALGYVIAEDVSAPLNVPPFRASIVDGYAVLHTDCPGVLPVSCVATAASSLATFESKTCVRITTGAPVPHGATAVVPVENTSLVEQRDGEEILIRIEASGVKSGDNIRDIGSDVALGSLLLSRGTRLSSLGGEIGLLASIGSPEVSVYARPVVGVLSTGDEVIPVTTACYGSHIWDSNRPMLLAALRASLGRDNVVDLGIVRDNPKDIEEALTRALNKVDLLVTTGGVSMGELDLLKPSLEKLNGKIHFGRVAMKPGKPVTFATVGEKLVFALPGNPVSAMVCMCLFVAPAIRKWVGADPNHDKVSVVLSTDVKLDPRPEFHRVVVERNRNGTFSATSTGFQRSSCIQSMVRANALLCLPPAEREGTVLPKGTTVDAILLDH